ncbi:MAG: hypothetical protein SGPRY_008594, partial [Prymnesium sp.]
MAALLLRSAACLGWTTIPQTAFGGQYAEIGANLHSARVNGSLLDVDPRRSLGRIWHMPELVSDTSGLGGSLTYAWDPNLCPKIQPLFKEELFFYNL